MPTTTENLTKQQIRTLRDEAWEAGDAELHGACIYLLHTDLDHDGYRSMVVRAINKAEAAKG